MKQPKRRGGDRLQYVRLLRRKRRLEAALCRIERRLKREERQRDLPVIRF